MKITILPSEKGDCLLVEAGGVAILADGGMPASYAAEVRPFLGKWAAKGNKLDLVYVSHVDQDHIGGILAMLEDMVLWRVFRHEKASGKKPKQPAVPEPPGVQRIWHNAFKALVEDNAGEIGTMLASRANTLSSGSNPSLGALKLAAAYRNIANSIPEAIKVSRRIAADQLNIPLNREFGGKLALVRSKKALRLKPGSSLSIRVIGPFEEDLRILRDFWNKWLKHKDNADNVKSLLGWLKKHEGGLGTAGVGLSIDDEIGHRDDVTEPNLASLMLLLEEKTPGGKIRVAMTGDGHGEDVLAGLVHHGLLAEGRGLHVNVLKIPHHGSEHNMDRAFAKRLTADHYVVCADGQHENPDLRILEVIVKARIGAGDELSANPEAARPFTIWLNNSIEYLENQAAKKVAQGKKPSKDFLKGKKHFADVERELEKWKNESGGRMTLNYLKTEPLVLQL